MPQSAPAERSEFEEEVTMIYGRRLTSRCKTGWIRVMALG
jgi:hypothetical protein